MFDNYINKYFSLLSIEESDNDVNLSEIMSLKSFAMPIKRFISSEINRIVITSIDNIRNQTLFDQSNSDLLKLINRLEQELKSSIRMTSFEFNEFIKNIIEIRFNFICRPLTTLSHLIFQKNNEQSIHEIQNIIEYFDEYNYLLEGISEWYENNLAQNFLTKEEFENIIKDIDDDYIYNLDVKEFKKLLNPIFKIFSFDNIENDTLDEVPIEALIIFFSEKGIFPILKILEEEFENNNLTISKERINSLIDKMLDETNDESTTEDELVDSELKEIESEDLDELEYFTEELDSESEENIKDLEEVDELSDLEYFNEEDELEIGEKEKIELEEKVEENDLDELEYFTDELETDGERLERESELEEDDELSGLEYFSDDEDDLVKNDEEKKEKEEDQEENFDEIEYFTDEDISSDDENLDEIDLNDFLDEESETNKEKE